MKPVLTANKIDLCRSSIINEGVNGTTPLIVNKMIAHPDAAVSSPGRFDSDV